MPNLTKSLFAIFLAAISINAVAETILISKQQFDQTLDQAKDAYVAEDYALAAEQFAKAAQWGDKYSQYVLGTMFHSGQGVEKDPVTAYAWLATAAESRNKDYRRAAKTAFKSLDAAQQQKAESLSEQLTSRYGMDATGVRCKRDGRTGSNIKSVICKHTRLATNGAYIVPVYEVDAIAASSSGIATSESDS